MENVLLGYRRRWHLRGRWHFRRRRRSFFPSSLISSSVVVAVLFPVVAVLFPFTIEKYNLCSKLMCVLTYQFVFSAPP